MYVQYLRVKDFESILNGTSMAVAGTSFGDLKESVTVMYKHHV